MFHSAWSREVYLDQLALLDAKLIILPSPESNITKTCDQDLVDAILDLKTPVVYLHDTAQGCNIDEILKRTGDLQWTDSSKIDPKDGALVSMTSGSTGKPKGVLISHVGIIHCAPSLLSCSEAKVGDKLCYTLLSGDKNCPYIFANCALAGITLVIPHFKYSTTRYLQALSLHKCSTLMAPPFIFLDMLNLKSKMGDEADVSHLTAILTLGNMLKQSITQKAFTGFPSLKMLTNAYGSTETGLISLTTITEEHVDHVGQLTGHVIAKVVDEANQVVPFGQDGRILVKTAKRMIGYYKGPVIDTSCFDEDGFYDTGDKGSFDSKGNLYLNGRTKEIINIGGIKVYPIVIEAFVDQHEDVLSSHVMAVEDERLGHLIGAWVYVKQTSNLSADGLKSFLKTKTKDTKNTMPEAIFVSKSAPPKLAGGKLDGALMRRTLQQLKDSLVSL
ncbi:Medium-chain acyl-CoA ligase ACSF2, mitochondrial [Halotydeus destructor]|nr:Medium-chain acyl-CoA ligase ACSF2, mitochondrial [Halotydeus destructor]